MRISLVVDTRSLAKELAGGDVAIRRVLDLGRFPFVTIERVASESTPVGNGFIPIIPGRHLAIPLREPRDADAEYLRLTVVSCTDPRTNGGLSRDFVAPIEALSRVRLFLVERHHFELQPGLSIDEGVYYLYRYKKLVPAFQLAWSVALAASDKEIPQKVVDQLHSLSTRLAFICRGADQVSIHALESPTNNSEDVTLYHLGYLCMLATGAFDDIAGIANQLYGLGVHHRQLTLKIDNRKQN